MNITNTSNMNNTVMFYSTLYYPLKPKLLFGYKQIIYGNYILFNKSNDNLSELSDDLSELSDDLTDSDDLTNSNFTGINNLDELYKLMNFDLTNLNFTEIKNLDEFNKLYKSVNLTNSNFQINNLDEFNELYKSVNLTKSNFQINNLDEFNKLYKSQESESKFNNELIFFDNLINLFYFIKNNVKYITLSLTLTF